MLVTAQKTFNNNKTCTKANELHEKTAKQFQTHKKALKTTNYAPSLMNCTNKLPNICKHTKNLNTTTNICTKAYESRETTTKHF